MFERSRLRRARLCRRPPIPLHAPFAASLKSLLGKKLPTPPWPQCPCGLNARRILNPANRGARCIVVSCRVRLPDIALDMRFGLAAVTTARQTAGVETPPTDKFILFLLSHNGRPAKIGDEPGPNAKIGVGLE